MKNKYEVAFVVSLSIALFGCDAIDGVDVSHQGSNAPMVYLGSGVKLEIADGQTAHVFGYGECPDSSSQLLFGLSALSKGCTRLTDRHQVDVRLIMQDGLVTIETWNVIWRGQDVSLKRPNGWMVRESDIQESMHDARS